jgi:WD40 repeat protein
MPYDAFISYSHVADGKLAPRVQSGLHRFARPLFRFRALHVFRDQTSLSATPELWSSIEAALDQSNYFILMASPESAASFWIQRELDHWLHNTPGSRVGLAVKRLLIIMTNGEIFWDQEASDFDWRQTSALPRLLAGVFREEPLYVDMRWARSDTDLSPRNPRFLDQIADLASAIHERPKEDLIGEDVRQFRRTRRLAWSGGTAIGTLAIAALGFAIYAWVQLHIAQAGELAARAGSQLDVDPHQSLVLATRAVGVSKTVEAMSVLRETLIRSHLRGILASTSGPVTDAKFGPTGDKIAGTVCRKGEQECAVQLWQAKPLRPTCVISGQKVGRFSKDGLYIISKEGQTFDARTCQPATGEQASQVISEIKSPGFELHIEGDDLIIREAGSKKEIRRLVGRTDSSLPAEKQIGGSVFSGEGDYGNYLVTWAATGIYSESGGGSTEIGDKRAYLWGVRDAVDDSILAGHTRAITAAAFGPQAEFVVTASDDRTAKIWITRGGQEFETLHGHPDRVTALAVSQDGSKVLTIGQSGIGMLWEPGTRKAEKLDFRNIFALRYGRTLPALQGNEQPVELPKLSSDGTTVIALVDTHRIAVWDAATGMRRALLSDDSVDAGTLRAWPNRDGQRIVTTTGNPSLSFGDEFATVWDVATGQVIGRLEGQEGPIYAAAYSPDGSFIATAADGGTVRLWRASDLKLVKSGGISEGRVLDVEFDSTGRRLVTASRDSISRILENPTLEPLFQLSGHEGGVIGASFSPDDSLVVTVGEDDTIVWDSTSGKQLGRYLGTEAAINFISHDCSKLVIGSYDANSVRVHPFGACGSDELLIKSALQREAFVGGKANF